MNIPWSAQVFRPIASRIWRKPEFRRFTGDEKLITFYLLTSIQANSVGYYYLSIAMATEDLGMSAQTFLKGLGNVCDTLGWWFDDEANVVWISTWWRYNRPENPNVMIGHLKALNEVPDSYLDSLFFNNLKDMNPNIAEVFTKTVGIRYAKRLVGPSSDVKRSKYDEKLAQGLLFKKELHKKLLYNNTNNTNFCTTKNSKTSCSTVASLPEPPKPAPGIPSFSVKAAEEKDRAWALPESKLFEWKKTYPGMDITAEILTARQWLLDNPTRRKTAGGMSRFLGSWLKRANDNGQLKLESEGSASGPDLLRRNISNQTKHFLERDGVDNLTGGGKWSAYLGSFVKAENWKSFEDMEDELGPFEGEVSGLPVPFEDWVARRPELRKLAR